MPATSGPAAQSLYRQARLTFTQNASGSCAFSLYGKGLRDDWREQHCLLRSSVVVNAPLRSTEDVLSAMAIIIEDLLLPQ